MTTINLTDDQERILSLVFQALNHQGEVTYQEEMEIAFSALLDSFDSSMDATEEQKEEGSAVDAVELRRAVERTLSPNISVEDLEIAAASTATEQPKQVTFEDFASEEPNNPLVIEAKQGDQWDREAVRVAFDNFPKSEWAGSQVADLVHKSAAALRERMQGKNVVDKG